MLTKQKIQRYNNVLAEKLSVFLNVEPDFITDKIIDELTFECSLTKEEAFGFVLASAIGFDTENNSADREIFEYYFPSMLRCLDTAVYTQNPYYKNISIPERKEGRWSFQKKLYKPYEAFVYNDLLVLNDGRIIPQIGFFTEQFSYPAVLENSREWMLITPNEIETMKSAVNNACGKVLTYGLGLGYFAYMVSQKSNVYSVTAVERDVNVIKLFKKIILPQFEYGSKINIVQADAFEYARNCMSDEKFDYVYTDLWHDPSDGIELYLKMKELEKLSPQSRFDYWIEPTLKCYLT